MQIRRLHSSRWDAVLGHPAFACQLAHCSPPCKINVVEALFASWLEPTSPRSLNWSNVARTALANISTTDTGLLLLHGPSTTLRNKLHTHLERSQAMLLENLRK
jgi:hypothetical protein